MLERALRNRVHAIVAIGYDPERWQTTTDLCRRYPFVRRTVGLHPNSAEMWSDDLRAELETEISRGDAVAIGETGLDFFREHASPAKQRAAVAAQLELARQSGLPIIVHQRQAEHEVVELVARHAPLRGAMHCFSGDEVFAKQCLELGFHLGIGGVATYPKSDPVRQAIASAPVERLILETDSPFLAPRSHRGKRNEPGYLSEIADTIATVQHLDVARVVRSTTDNAVDLFGPSLRDAIRSGVDWSTEGR
jgi:TatD DNase family protein